MDGCTVFLNVSDVNIKTQGHLGKHLGTTPVINAVDSDGLFSKAASSAFVLATAHPSYLFLTLLKDLCPERSRSSLVLRIEEHVNHIFRLL